MEHPLIPNLDDLSMEELQDRITDLTRKLSWASAHNQQLAHQIGMALESYQTKYRERQQEIWDRAARSGTDYSDKIDIS